MLLYGEEYSQVNGKIKKIDTKFFHIYVDTLKRRIIVPKYIVKNDLSLILDETQVIQLPNWFLRKNKIIGF
ncbi:hypothetical protein [Candidatus Lokiarchaeum ossiferum]|uniref:hypothetical protein n=1 Tax=Candidatus Lokiarchaeum ossiferum TaxID=2951803 RepID=UPI00352F5B09